METGAQKGAGGAGRGEGREQGLGQSSDFITIIIYQYINCRTSCSIRQMAGDSAGRFTSHFVRIIMNTSGASVFLMRRYYYHRRLIAQLMDAARDGGCSQALLKNPFYRHRTKRQTPGNTDLPPTSPLPRRLTVTLLRRNTASDGISPARVVKIIKIVGSFPWSIEGNVCAYARKSMAEVGNEPLFASFPRARARPPLAISLPSSSINAVAIDGSRASTNCSR